MNENYIDQNSVQVQTDEGVEESAKLPGRGLAMTSFICGIISLVTLGNIGPLIWVAIICGAVGRTKYPKYTSEYHKSEYGMIMGIIALVLAFLLGIILGLIIVIAPIIYANS